MPLLLHRHHHQTCRTPCKSCSSETLNAQGHFGVMKAKIAKLRTQLLEPAAGQANAGTGFDVVKYGDSRVAIIGFPSVPPSSSAPTFSS